jgi:hypothetical protein
MHRRSAPKVRDGRVQKKNNWDEHPADYHVWPQPEIRLDRRDPGPGHRHLITIAQLREFVELLPIWDDVAVDLDAIVLDGGQHNTMGWCSPGVVAICAWDQGLWWPPGEPGWIDEHRDLLERLEVEIVAGALRWTAEQARAFQLLHILPHELGHHHDRITTRTQLHAGRGEPYAEAYANRVLDELWPAYTARFGL